MNHKQIAIDLFLNKTKYKRNEIIKVKQIHNGFTNISFLFITSDHQKFQVRIANDNGMVSRTNEKAIYDAIQCKNFVYFDLANGNTIKKWIPGRNPGFITIRRKWFQKELIDQINKLHLINVEKYRDKIMVHNYTTYFSKTVFPNQKHHDKYLELITKYINLELVLSHNDINADNCLFYKRDVVLIDYEWGRMNSKYWDLANFIRETNISFRLAQKMCIIDGNLDWRTLKDFIYLSTNFAYQWAWAMPETPKIIQYRKKAEKNLEHWYKKMFSLENNFLN